MKLFYQKSFKENSMRNLKHFKIDELINIIPKNEIDEETLEYGGQENKKNNYLIHTSIIKKRQDTKQKNFIKPDSLIDSNINNKDKDSVCKYLYLEYKRENNEN